MSAALSEWLVVRQLSSTSRSLCVLAAGTSRTHGITLHEGYKLNSRRLPVAEASAAKPCEFRRAGMFLLTSIIPSEESCGILLHSLANTITCNSVNEVRWFALCETEVAMFMLCIGAHRVLRAAQGVGKGALTTPCDPEFWAPG